MKKYILLFIFILIPFIAHSQVDWGDESEYENVDENIKKKNSNFGVTYDSDNSDDDNKISDEQRLIMRNRRLAKLKALTVEDDDDNDDGRLTEW